MGSFILNPARPSKHSIGKAVGISEISDPDGIDRQRCIRPQDFPTSATTGQQKLADATRSKSLKLSLKILHRRGGWRGADRKTSIYQASSHSFHCIVVDGKHEQPRDNQPGTPSTLYQSRFRGSYCILPPPGLLFSFLSCDHSYREHQPARQSHSSLNLNARYSARTVNASSHIISMRKTAASSAPAQVSQARGEAVAAEAWGRSRGIRLAIESSIECRLLSSVCFPKMWSV